MTLGVYRVTDQAKRISMRQPKPGEKDYHDPREQEVDMAGAIRAVRAERVRDLERLWAEGFFGNFDHLIVMWHRMDSTLFLALSIEPRHHAAKLLLEEGLL